MCTDVWLMESIGWVCADGVGGGGHIVCVCWECTLMLGGENVIWLLGE